MEKLFFAVACLCRTLAADAGAHQPCAVWIDLVSVGFFPLKLFPRAKVLQKTEKRQLLLAFFLNLYYCPLVKMGFRYKTGDGTFVAKSCCFFAFGRHNSKLKPL